MTTYYLDSFEELKEVYASVEEDIATMNFVPFLGGELDKLSNLHREFFRKQTGPDDQAWPKNAPSTIRAKGHHRILRGHPKNKHRLSRSLTDKGRQTADDAVREAIQTDTGGYLSFGTAVEYSHPHDAPRGKIPARRHVGMNERHLDGMVERLADYAIKELAKG